ncbi:O-succinylbenzoic acid--CoA ligase [Candidatus Nanopelagicaceae bacterium]
MARLAKALVGDSPAIALGPVSVENAPQRVALIVNTSGSTGAAKEVGLSASALLESAKSANKFVGAKPGQIWSLLLPITHIAGINVLVRSLELGTVPIDSREVTGKYPYADFTAVVPTQLFKALNGDSNLLEHLISAQAVLVGGAALSTELRDSSRNAGINVIETYGMTETSGGCVYNGTALDGTEFEIDELGIISIASKSLATTYLNAPEAWSERIRNGYFVTTDIGHIQDGKLIVTGRSDDVIITGGENVSLAEVESVVRDTFAGIECAAFTIPDSQWGQLLLLAIAGEVKPDQSAINEYLSSKISRSAKVKNFIYVAELPRTSLGKIDRAKLAEIATEVNHG